MKWFALILTLVLGFAGGMFFSPTRGDPSGPIEAADEGSFFEKNISAPSAANPELGSVDVEGITPEYLEELEELEPFDRIGRLHASLKSMAVSEFPALMKKISDQPSGSLNWQALSMISARWAQLDPQGMLAYANENSTERSSWGLYNTIFSEWARQDADAAFSAAMNLDSEQSQRSAMHGIITSISAEQPQRAIEIAREFYGNELGGNGRWLFQSIFRNWAQRDLSAARTAALALENGGAKSAALTGAIGEWMEESPFEALEWLNSLPMDSTVYNSRKEVFRKMLNQDFEVAREFIESVDSVVERREILSNMYFQNIAWKMDFEEIQGVFDWIGTVATGSVYDSRVSGIVSSMTEKDPDKAIEFVLQMRPGNARMNALNSIGSKLAEMDPQRAFEFVDSLEFEDEKQRALGSMSWRLSQQGIEAASVLVGASDDPLVQQQLASGLSSEWSKYDQAAALKWSETLADEKARKSAVESVMKNWIQAEPEKAFAYIEENMEVDTQGNTFRNAFSDWANNDPLEAVAWLDSLPESVDDRKADIYRSVASSYIRHDPMAASEWIGTLDDGKARDQAVETLVNNISKSDPEAGFIWAATVDDQSKRKSTLRRSVQEWVKTDPDAVYRAVVDAEIEAEEKEPLLKMIENAQD